MVLQLECATGHIDGANGLIEMLHEGEGKNHLLDYFLFMYFVSIRIFMDVYA